MAFGNLKKNLLFYSILVIISVLIIRKNTNQTIRCIRITLLFNILYNVRLCARACVCVCERAAYRRGKEKG